MTYQLIVLLSNNIKSSMQDCSMENINIPALNLKSLKRLQLQAFDVFEPKSNPQVIFQQTTKEDDYLLSYNQIRKSSTHRLYEVQADQSESDMGSEWANWNIHRIKIFPTNQGQENDQLFAHNRLRKRKSRSANKRGKSPSKLTIKAQNNQKAQKAQKQTMQRERRRVLMNQVLGGKGSFIWLFILGKNISQKQLNPIRNIYKQFADNDYVSPLCRSFDEAKRFFKMENCFFKIITDLECSQAVIQESNQNSNIIAIYLYSNIKQKGASDILSLKRKSRKIKGTFTSINEAVDQVSQDLSQQARFIEINQTLEKVSKFRFRFPGFFVLSGTDNSQVIQYRLCLYGALKLKNKTQKMLLLKQFVDMVQMRYQNDQKQLSNLKLYNQIDQMPDNDGNKAAQILKFYVKQNFFYAVTNSLLRIARSSQEFRPCTIPFNQIYHAIKYYHLKSKGNKKSFKAYRGAKLRSRQVSSLAIGSFIELLGFTSSSLSRNEALKFMDDDSYLIEIYVNDEDSKQTTDSCYQHGYVQINKYGLAHGAFSNQEEVLFNALNVYQVVQIDLRSAIRTVTLKYGALKQLAKKPTQKLTTKEATVLQNMQYCIKQFNSIEDDGDVLLLTQEHEKAKQFYTKVLRQNEINPRIHAKLAEVEGELGNLEAAEHHALQMMEYIKQKQALKLYEEHGRYHQTINRVTQILQITENIDKYEELVQMRVKMTENCFENSNLLIERAQTKMRRGQLQGCLADLVRADCLFQQKKNSFIKRINQINKQYFLKSICTCFNRGLSTTLQTQKQNLLLKIQQQEINFKANESKVYQLKVKIEQIKAEYMQKIGDRKKMQECQENIRKYFKKIKEKDEQISPMQAARYYALQALANKKTDFSQYEVLMETAIQIIKQNDPYHQEIAKLSQSLADQRLNRIKNILSYSSTNNTKNQEKQQTSKKLKQKFDYQHHKKLYKKCRSSYNQAIQIFCYHKGKDHPQSITTQNKLTELNVEFSLLKQAEYSALCVTKRKYAERHSEGAKSYLLLSKISLCRGQLKKAFKMIDQADKILNIALCPRNNKSFILKHPLYYEINLTKAKIFHKQTRHDLALRQLSVLQKMSLKQTAAQQLLACIHQVRGDIKLDEKDNDSFERQIQKAIEIRKRVQGKFNVNNATNLQKLAIALKFIKQQKKSLNSHSLAVQIFSRFPPDHPNCWIIHLANSIIFKDKKPVQIIAHELHQCLQVAQKRFSPDNINLAKVQIQVCKVLVQLGMQRRALGLYQVIDRNLEHNLRLSLAKETSLLEKDDEKVGLRKKLLKQMIILYESAKGSQLEGIIGVQRCKNSLSLLQNSYNDDRNESLKSLA